MRYDYSASKQYCEAIGLQWLGDEFVVEADRDAEMLGFTQEQVDCAMRHSLWHIRCLFLPSSYSFLNRVKLALYFLTGIHPKKR